MYDTKLRRKPQLIETSGQALKDAGISEFKTSCEKALDGVLFIDEAYALDPLADSFNGRPIVNELLKEAEDQRDRLTVISRPHA